MMEMVPYHKPSAEKAKEITKENRTPLAKFMTITAYVSHCFVYDYVRAIKVAKQHGVMPDIGRTWHLKMGICQDTAAMTVGMLRAVGIKATLFFGKADGRNHAWVEAEIDGKTYLYDHDGKAKEYKAERRY